MADKDTQKAVLELIQHSRTPLSISGILAAAPRPVAERTLRRWLASWADAGIVIRSGHHKSTRYAPVTHAKMPSFLQSLSKERQLAVLKQLRDLWTHTSTALEGNTLSLGDTHFLLEEGLTVSGKPLKDHQEVVGHAKAIDIIYECLGTPLTVDTVFSLHKAIQTEQVFDIYKPNGAWKLEVNGTYIVTRDNQQHFLEYAHPLDVPALMNEIIHEINQLSKLSMNLDDAPKAYAKIHAGIAHAHPFWDGNGRIARLLANIPLLNSGFPPLVIAVEDRRRYIQILAEYELQTGIITQKTGAWPKLESLIEFEQFCADSYETTKHILLKS